MSKKLYVGGIPYETTDASLSELFGAYGSVVSVKIIVDRETNRSRGFAFVEMESDEAAQSAISALDGQEFDGRKITVNEARPQEERSGSKFGGRRYNGSDNRRSF